MLAKDAYRIKDGAKKLTAAIPEFNISMKPSYIVDRNGDKVDIVKQLKVFSDLRCPK